MTLLNMRFHQELITRKTSILIEESNKQFLWGVKCRGGKTYMVGGLIIKQKELKEKYNAMIITPAPTETSPQFTEDLFQKFDDFNCFTIINLDSSKKIGTMKLTKNNIFIVSKQLLQQYVKNDTINKIKNLNLDLIVFDENHFGGTTQLSKNILDSYLTNNTVKLYLTATYGKCLREWNISQDCQMYWDIEDEQWCKQRNLDMLLEKHGPLVKDLLNTKNLEKQLKIYDNYPDIHMITNLFDTEKYDKIMKETKMSDGGFSFDALLSLKAKNKDFNFLVSVKEVLGYMSGSLLKKIRYLIGYTNYVTNITVENH